jgi:SagB-type dehydrogenase family enzyme
MSLEKNANEIVFNYHQQTKHRFDGYAKGPETIDWDAQPFPFRHFDGAPQLKLPLQKEDSAPPFSTLIAGDIEPAATWNEASISQLLQFALGLSAWKQYGTSRWSLRCNPSSGNLHPTECYPILLGIEGFADGLYHYRADEHQLELRCRYPEAIETATPTLLLGLSSVQWREAWKYGERAYRYCQLDVGHALAALSYNAATLGHRVIPLLSVGNSELQQLLGIDRSSEFFDNEREAADLLVAIHPPSQANTPSLDKLLRYSSEGEWQGKANRLDPRHHYEWPIIEEVSQAAERPQGSETKVEESAWPEALAAADHPLSQQPASRLFRQRRSAQAFHPDGSISAEDFFRILDHLLPRSGLSPWSSQHWPTRLHLLIFVHAVEGLAPGLYLLARRKDAADEVRAQLREDLPWEAVAEAPSHLPFYKLVGAKARKTAMKLSCLQDIAGNSAFALSMLAEFGENVEQAPWHYNELHWEAGMIGHTLYLEAEAIGLRGTGIGCFFDDGVHDMLGIKGNRLQTLYHFTVGEPVNDARLATLPPYPEQSD